MIRMLDRSWTRWTLVGMAFLLMLGVPLSGRADEPDSLQDSLFTNSRQVRQVFREVVASPRTWTVRLSAGEEKVALGIVVDANGWIVSKASQATSATTARLSDGREFPIEMIGYHQAYDLALLKVSAQELPVATWNHDNPKVGAWMVSVGLRKDPVALGVMSVPRRKIPRSEVYGVLGIELAEEELPRIHRVFPNSGASEAGLQEGDVVLEVDQHAISTGRQLVRTLRGYRPGDTLALRVRRDDEEIAYAVTLTHPFGAFLSRIAFQNQMGGPLSFRRDDFEAVYQHDAVIDPADCGGPVVNLDGQVVGMNIARAGRTETYVLPADLIVSVLEDMMAGKYPPPGQINAADQDESPEPVAEPAE